MEETRKYDFVIIGSGLGGLECAYILASEGYSVCVLEKNHQLGGNLQVFSRDKVVFDTGVHYIGGLDEGQNLNQLFKYFGLMDKLKLLKMDEDKFDVVSFDGDPNEYYHAQGYDRFAESLIRQFPDEEEAINSYCKTIQQVCSRFPLYSLKYSTDSHLEDDVLGVGVVDYLERLTKNEKLRSVLAGTNLLYAGYSDKTPLYVHALVVNSYIQSSYRCIDGGSQIAKYLAKQIREMGGDVIKHKNVVSFEYEGENITAAVTDKGERFFGKTFISNAHPQATVAMVEEGRMRKAYTNRINDMENSISTFVVSITCKPNTFKYRNYNYYHHSTTDVWAAIDYDPQNWPTAYMLSTPAHGDDDEYAKGIILVTYMRFEEFEEWKDSHNTVAEAGERGEAYRQFKKEKEKQVIDYASQKFPDLKDSINAVYSSTPLTFRDYIGNLDGSLYGVVKDYKSPLKSFITPKTKIPNLYLTGQNINLHGILGVTISSLVTCSEFVDKRALLEKIKQA